MYTYTYFFSADLPIIWTPISLILVAVHLGGKKDIFFATIMNTFLYCIFFVWDTHILFLCVFANNKQRQHDFLAYLYGNLFVLCQVKHIPHFVIIWRETFELPNTFPIRSLYGGKPLSCQTHSPFGHYMVGNLWAAKHIPHSVIIWRETYLFCVKHIPHPPIPPPCSTRVLKNNPCHNLCRRSIPCQNLPVPTSNINVYC
jgi:hypothetical protein